MDQKRDSWHLSEERLEKLERMSCWRLDLLLLRAYWLKYREPIQGLVLAAMGTAVWMLIFGHTLLGVIGGLLFSYYVFLIVTLRQMSRR